jgi:hypothetical protein
VLNLDAQAKEYLIREGTDLRYGARPLKRAIDRSLVHPLSNLIASNQVRGGDMIEVEYDTDHGTLEFLRETGDVPVYGMMRMAEIERNVRPEGAGLSRWLLGADRLEVTRTAGGKSPKPGEVAKQ